MKTVNETGRKLLHIGMLGFALLLRPLTWWQGAVMAVLALGYNLFLFRRVHGEQMMREHERGRDVVVGLAWYPLSVLILILLYRHELIVAGAAWAVLGLGDGVATLAGKAIGGPRLPWNRGKSWAGSLAFVLFGTLGAMLLGHWLAERTVDGEAVSSARILAAALIASLLAALVESFDVGVDDNITVPAVAGAAFWLVLHADLATLQDGAFHRQFLIGAGVSVATGLLALAARGVDRAGLLVGVLIGTLVWAGTGAPGYLVLFAFFVLGTVATRLGYRRKLALGIAEPRGGRRSSGSALAKGLVGAGAALGAALVLPCREAFTIAVVAAFATAAADTVSSEVGKAFGRRAYLAATLRRVEPGTEGAISIEGTLAGIAGGAAVSAVALATGLLPWPLSLCVAVAAALANYLESVAGQLVGAAGELENELLNLLVTLAGAVIAVLLAGAVG